MGWKPVHNMWITCVFKVIHSLSTTYKQHNNVSVHRPL